MNSDEPRSDASEAEERTERLGRPARTAILAAAGLAGTGVMTVELAAVRLLAPHFGSSTSVWTNVIGVVLVALAVGYVLGARWSRGPEPARRFMVVLGAAALWLCVLPFVAPAVGEALRPQDVALHAALPLLTWGSLAAALVLFAPPIAVLGTAGPLAVELVQRTGVAHAGTAGGWVLGSSTAGSLVGTFATTHLLVPGLGLRGTFLVAAALLLLAAGALALGRGARRDAALALALGAVATGASALVPQNAPLVGSDARLVAWAESPMSQVRVVERGRVDDGTLLRFLQVGETSDSFQSVWQSELGLFPLGYYYNDFALPLWWSSTDATADARVLFAGLGAGSAWRVMRGAAPDGLRLRGVGLEIDPLVVEMARTHLELDDPNLEIVAGADARAVLRSIEGSFDVVTVDAYTNQFEIPEHLATVEYFQEIVQRLEPGGWLVSNAAGFGFDDPVVRALGETIATAFDSPVLALRVPFSRNISLFARREAPLVLPNDPRFIPEHPELGRQARLRRVPGNWTTYDPVDDPQHDMHSCMSRLQVHSLRAAAATLRLSRP